MKLILAATILRTFPLAILLVCALALVPASLFAKEPPDGNTPSKETLCDGFEGCGAGRMAPATSWSGQPGHPLLDAPADDVLKASVNGKGPGECCGRGVP